MRPRWQAQRGAAGHADDWLMTYADMITLLLCFFAVFLSISMQRKDAPPKAQIAQTVPLPPPPDFLEGNLPFHGLAHADRPTKDAAAAEPPAPASAVPVKADAPPAAAGQAPSQATVEARIIPPPELFDAPQAQGTAKVEQRGDRIISVEMSSAAFFASGSATLSPGGEAILRQAAVNLKADKFRDYQITVEGHTDDTPINTPRFPSNWELSTARAAAVVHFFLDQGIPAQKLRAAGYADTFPEAPNRDANGNAIPANQARNRRVVIKLEKIEKTDGGPAAAPGAHP